MRDRRRLFFLFLMIAFLVSLASPLSASTVEEGHKSLGELLPLWSAIPFVGILLSIALFPLLAPKFWHHHFGKVSLFWSLLFFVPFFIAFPGEAKHELVSIIFVDYIPFLLLLWALFTISGGILLKGSLKGTPAVNTLILLVGTFLSSWVGTTGSAMLMIRPILRANKERKYKVHTIAFFIFLVANIGGCLTPLGDPPLFLGFLHGVPFFWTMGMAPILAFTSAVLLVIYFLLDTFYFKKEGEKALAESGEKEPLRIEGGINFLILLGVVGSTVMSGFWHPGSVSFLGINIEIENILRNVLFLILGFISWKVTTKKIRQENDFSWGPILEVAKLFAGIFVTIIPAIAILKAGDKGSLGFLMAAVTQPAHYFWASGALSSFLDNAPTYLTFFNSAVGAFVVPLYGTLPDPVSVKHLIAENHKILLAISAGSVFMGANTYIGNAPNFMVKSIAEEAGVEMPSFFGYIFKYSLIFLIPVFILVTLVFF